MEKIDLIFLFIFTCSVLWHCYEVFAAPARAGVSQWVMLLINMAMCAFLWGMYGG
jgi:hypothetical protein